MQCVCAHTLVYDVDFAAVQYMPLTRTQNAREWSSILAGLEGRPAAQRYHTPKVGCHGPLRTCTITLPLSTKRSKKKRNSVKAMSMPKQMKNCSETFDPVHAWFKVSQEHFTQV